MTHVVTNDRLLGASSRSLPSVGEEVEVLQESIQNMRRSIVRFTVFSSESALLSNLSQASLENTNSVHVVKL